MNVRHAMALVCALTACAATVAPAATVDFDNSTDMNSFSKRTSGGVVGDYTWSSASGVGGAPGVVSVDIVSSSQDAENLFHVDQTYHADVEPVMVSVFFLAEAATSTAVSRNFVGVATGTGTNLATSANKLGVRVLKNGTTDWSFQLQNGTSTVNVGSTFSLTDNHWYRMSFTITATGTANTYALTGDLTDFGIDGLAAPTSVRNGSDTFVNSHLGTAPSWVMGLLGQRSGGGARAFDNLTIVPEPTTVGLLAIGSLVILRRRRSQCC
jgi:hypothetical protein